MVTRTSRPVPFEMRLVPLLVVADGLVIHFISRRETSSPPLIYYQPPTVHPSETQRIREDRPEDVTGSDFPVACSP